MNGLGGNRMEQPRKENYRFCLQVCAHCGEKFPVIYWYKQNRIELFGAACDCFHRGFYPVEGEPTFREWKKIQDELRVQEESPFQG